MTSAAELQCENGDGEVERCDCGVGSCAGWRHPHGHVMHWCGPDYATKQPYPLPRRRVRVRGYGGYRLPAGRRGSTT